ncbi:MAG: STAS domain-containing protein [Aeromicrobium sp.]|uniref:STAS domain-containing protein n=1 Tax=Aeromicrobium sp. TaxID=1871063 RepID=UPI00261E1089|nr:STAS domain-containing protein [Aeromicrobium sp.]MDF1706183.1 STAS domain-containing protein [Aeromicrobium sp.]
MSDQPTDARPDVPLSVTREDRAGHVLFTLDGDIDIETARHLRAELIAGLPSGDERVVVDLSKVDFMDSSGLGALVGAWKIVRENGAFRVAGANSVVHRVLTITGMENVFEIHPDLESALPAQA